MAQSTGSEPYCVQAPARRSGKAASPEKMLNCFVRSVALVERAGNALGTLAFTWATVVLLGGYPTVLRPTDDFWFATAIVFLEAARMFSRNNRLDYQVFFHTRGAVRSLGWKGMVVIVSLSNVINYLFMISRKHLKASPEFGSILIIGMLILTAAVGQFLSPGALKLLGHIPPRRSISLCSPLVAILLLAPSIHYSDGPDLMPERRFRSTMAKWTVFIVLLLAVLLLTISRLRFRRITELLYSIVLESFGNLQIPAAVLRVVLALVRLIPHNYYDGDNTGDKTNLAPSLSIFYGMVLGQGILYLVACTLDIFTFIPRRSLARHGGFKGHQLGMETIKLYHGYVLEKCMEKDALAPKKISLSSFAMDSLNSDSPKIQLHGIQLIHNLLQTEPTKTQLLAKLTTCPNTSARLIKMLDWTDPRNATIRLFAAKVTAELAKGLRVITIPWKIQNVSTLLDYGNKQGERGNPLMDTDDDEQETMHDPVLNCSGYHEERLIAVPDTGNLLETQDRSTQQQVGTSEQSSWIVRCWRCMASIPKDEPLADTDKDLLPALGINCEEIVKATGLIPKIIGFTSYRRSDTTYTDTQGKVLVTSSLQLLHRLTSIKGEIGITLRHKISKHAFLLRNLAKILADSSSSQEFRKLVAGIIRNLAVDGNTRQEIGCIRVIITRLMQEFLSLGRPLGTHADHKLRKVAGQALAMLAMESAHNCSVMLYETGHVFIKELTTMIHDDKYRCVAASLLRNMCLHARHELNELDLQAISYSVREVLERIMDAEGAELEILICLGSQICKVIPEEFARELEHGCIKDRFVKRLVDALNANMEPSALCPGIRRVILEQVINMMEHDPHDASCFNNCRMMEAVSMVEDTASKAENYSIFLGHVGLMEHREPLTSLAARVKRYWG
uniref:BLE2 protein n=1 Tax=Setaria italica TaxID=4555 RepID=K3YPS4_SETIT